jgi:hypothetical protein
MKGLHGRIGMNRLDRKSDLSLINVVKIEKDIHLKICAFSFYFSDIDFFFVLFNGSNGDD